MEDRGQRVVNGGWRTEDRGVGWWMVDGGWCMEGGGCKMEDGGYVVWAKVYRIYTT